jgi:hypothetical protein
MNVFTGFFVCFIAVLFAIYHRMMRTKGAINDIIKVLQTTVSFKFLRSGGGIMLPTMEANL